MKWSMAPGMALMCVAMVAAVSVGLAAPAPQVETLPIGATAPDFSLPAVEGKTYTLKDFAGAKILAVVFTCNHCPTAIAYEERLKQLVAEYQKKGVAFVAISPNDPKALRLDEMGYTDLGDSFEEMKIRAKHAQFNFPYLYDGDTQQIARAYGPTNTPHVFLFDTERKLRYRGRIDDSENPKNVKQHYVRDALDALLAGKPVPVEVTKAAGCSIKWSDKRDSVVEAMKKLAAEPVTVKSVNLDGVMAVLKNNSDKLRLINFWATWCPPCQAEFPELVTINRMYRHRGFEMVLVSLDPPDKQAEVLEFLKKREASNTNLHYDSDDVEKLINRVGNKWEGAIPFTLLVRPGGQVVYSHVGIIDPLEVRRLIVKELGPRAK